MTNDDSLFASYFWWRDFYTITHYNIYNKSKKAITHLQAKYWYFRQAMLGQNLTSDGGNWAIF